MQVTTTNIETITRADIQLMGMTDTEVSDLLSLLHMGLEAAKAKAVTMSGPSKKARERLIATGAELADRLDKLEDVMRSETARPS